MTMHLVGPYLTTTNYRKRDTKVTQAKMNEWQEGYRERCKLNKQLGLPKQSFEEYVDMLHGRVKREKPKFVPLATQSKFDVNAERMRKHKEMYPSVTSMGGSTAMPTPKVYTGTEIIGIGQLHKSNGIPIFKKQDAEDLAKMRR